MGGVGSEEGGIGLGGEGEAEDAGEVGCSGVADLGFGRGGWFLEGGSDEILEV